MNSLQYFLILLIIPLVPAVVIYKLLPAQSGADVDGTFQGLKIKLSGAFAAYFVLVLVGIRQLPTPPASSQYEVWRVRGAVTGANPRTFAYERDMQLRLNPFATRYDDGTFTLDVLRRAVEGGGWEFPAINVECPGYYPRTIDLNNQRKVKSGGYRELIIQDEHLVLEPKPTPTPTPSANP